MVRKIRNKVFLIVSRLANSIFSKMSVGRSGAFFKLQYVCSVSKNLSNRMPAENTIVNIRQRNMGIEKHSVYT